MGITDRLTVRARRRVCNAGRSVPFRQAQELLEELSGWSIDAGTIRRTVHAEAKRATETRSGRDALPKAFAKTPGDWELQIDAGKVNTAEGWRDVKVGVFAKRERGESASSDTEERGLPNPGVRAVIAAVEGVGEFGPRCRAEADRLGLPDVLQLTVLGDGAEWIWGLAGTHFYGASEVLDVYHAIEHLATAGRTAVGEGPAFTLWLESAKGLLVGGGYLGACEALAKPLEDPEATAKLASASGEVLNYLANHRERLNYALRLNRGQSIGSGLVEGTIKELVNLRIKRTGARWRANHVGPFVEFLALANSEEYDEYWTSA